MDNIIFKISRTISLVCFLCISISYYFLFFVKVNYSVNDVLSVLFLTLICVMPLLIFNWFYFKKITLWVAGPND